MVPKYKYTSLERAVYMHVNLQILIWFLKSEYQNVIIQSPILMV